MKQQSRRPSAPLVISIIALIFAMAGSAAAVGPLITSSSQVRNGSINGRDVANRSLSTVDLSRQAIRSLQGQQGRQGPRGPQGAVGAQGAKGPGVQWALVDAAGAVLAQSGGIVVRDATNTGEKYIDFGSSLQGKALLALPQNAGGMASVAKCGGGGDGIACAPAGTDTPTTAVLKTRDETQAFMDMTTYVVVVN